MSLTNEIIGFFLYTSLIMLIAIPMSSVQFVKIQKQNDYSKSYINIITECYRKYGFKVFFRGVIPYSSIIGISAGVYPIAIIIYKNINIFGNPMNAGLLLTMVVTLIETAATLHFESKEILKNKIKDNTSMNVMTIALPSFFRNFINWLPVTISDEFVNLGIIKVQEAALYSVVFGFLSGIISLPFDVYLTRKFGEDSRKYNIQKFIDEVKKLGLNKMFTGIMPRCIQMSCYNVTIIFASYLKTVLL